MLPSVLRQCGLFANLMVVVVVSLAGYVQAKSFLRADLRWTGFQNAAESLQPNLTDLLALRELDQDPVFDKAMQVIDNLATQSTCHQAAAAQLLITCKASGRGSIQQATKHELLERAKSVYAVRVAVCETGEGRATVPTACGPVLQVPQRLHGELDVVHSKTLAACLEALMAEHYYWTSYSNNKQDANTLCQARTLEATRLEALHSYQKLAQLIPEFRDTLLSSRSQWLDFVKQQEEYAQHINQIQQRTRADLQEHHTAEIGSLRRAMNVAKEGLEDVSQLLQHSMAKAGLDISQTQEALKFVLSDFNSLRALLADSILTTSKKNTEMAIAQAQDMRSVHELAMATTEALKLLHADEAARDINGLLSLVKSELDRMVSAQSMQLSSTEQQLQLSVALSESQKANLALGEEIRVSSASLASQLDSTSVVAGRMSSKLDRVNQALARVERASSVLSTVLALITIPSQVAEHLHLRLLGAMSMPVTVLYFWKPRKYSYSLTAFYVFLESILSFFAEYREKISTWFEPQTIDYWDRNTSLAFMATGITLAICGFLMVTLRRRQARSRSSILTPKPIDASTFSERYYLEQRIRNGKGLRSSTDRYRRAASVC